MKKFGYLNRYLIIAIFLLLNACQSSAAPSNVSSASEIGKVIKVDNGTYKDISVTDLQTLMKNKDFTLVNVHIPFEGNLPKTDLSIPYDTIGQNLNKLPADKNSKIFLYCRSGRMSTIAANELVKLGYINIWNLDGGMAAWEQAGQPIER
jgi:rhodanese-related sulfurtransferase